MFKLSREQLLQALDDREAGANLSADIRLALVAYDNAQIAAPDQERKRFLRNQVENGLAFREAKLDRALASGTLTTAEHFNKLCELFRPVLGPVVDQIAAHGPPKPPSD